MNLNMKQQTLQYHTIPDGGGDDVVVPRPTPWWTGRSYSVLGGLVLLLVAAAVVLQGDHRPQSQDGGVFYTPPPMAYTPPPMAAEGMVLASITTLQNDAEDGCDNSPGCLWFGKRNCCMAAEGMVLASITTLQNDAEDGRGPGGCGPGRRFPC